jgi:K+-transporting ATPase A subunit
MFLETVSLILKHSDISTTTTLDSASSNNGSWSNGKQKTTWWFNIRSLLGFIFIFSAY